MICAFVVLGLLQSPPQTYADESPATKPTSGNEFLDDLAGTGQIDPASVIKRTLSSMRSAESLIREQKVGKDTQAVQEKVLEDLDRLISLAEKNMVQAPEAGDPLPPSEPPQDNKKPQETAKPNPQQSPRKDGTDDKQDSSDTTNQDKPKLEIVLVDRHRVVVQRAWGNLPPKLQSELRNMAGEKYLKQYESLIERYYEALAERYRRD